MGLADLAHYLDQPWRIKLCIHRIRDLGARMPEGEPGGLETEGLTDRGVRVMTEPVRMSGAGLPKAGDRI